MPKRLLPGGHKVNGIADLKKHLLTEKREQFARTLVSRMLAYSLGRSLELSDRETVDTITAQFIARRLQTQEPDPTDRGKRRVRFEIEEFTTTN